MCNGKSGWFPSDFVRVSHFLLVSRYENILTLADREAISDRGRDS